MYSKKVKTICPICDKNIDGEFVEQDGRILLKKTCPQHGEVTDLISSDAKLFKDKISLFDHLKDYKCDVHKCRDGIFNCSVHQNRKSPITFIEVTTRCNMKCPICYADADTKGKDVPLEDICRMLEKIAEEDKDTHLVLIGGEPTIHNNFFEILDKVNQLDLMRRTFVATNGITLADKEFCKKVYDKGVRKYYLGFDGTDQKACVKIRGNLKAYESVRLALENIRQLGKAWIILSFTASKEVNLLNLPEALKFAMENQDIVKRVMVTPEVFAGRVRNTSNLVNERLTGDCVENFISRELGVETATVPLTLFYILTKPLKFAGLLDVDKWAVSNFSPMCGQMGLIAVKDGKFVSMIDMLFKKPRQNAFKLGREIDALADKMEKANKFVKFVYYLPAYFFILLKYANKKFLCQAIGASFRYSFNSKKIKKALIGERRVELYYLLGSDKYNFIWDRLPHCANHHYRIHPATKEVIKLPGCLVFPFRENLENY